MARTMKPILEGIVQHLIMLNTTPTMRMMKVIQGGAGQSTSAQTNKDPCMNGVKGQ